MTRPLEGCTADCRVRGYKALHTIHSDKTARPLAQGFFWTEIYAALQNVNEFTLLAYCSC